MFSKHCSLSILHNAATFGPEDFTNFKVHWIAQTRCKIGVDQCSKLWRRKLHLFWEAAHFATLCKGGVDQCSKFWRTRFYHFGESAHWSHSLQRWCWPLQQLLALKSLSFLRCSTLRTLFAKVALSVAASFGAQDSTNFEVHWIAQTQCKIDVDQCNKFWRTKFYHFWESAHWSHPLQRWRWPLQQLLALKSLSFLGGNTLRTPFAKVA